ncbi:MAG: hypothetical protein HDT25_04990 [Ruminococcus sp.]|nr:hypothetical protein [Ruminococcus sp.]
MKGKFKMLNELKTVNEKFIALIKENSGVLAAWYFGSNTHGLYDKLSDEYSDIDIVILADEASYCDIDKSLTEMLKSVCDEVILCWGEDFNGEAMKNYDCLLSLNGKIFQYDIFLLNNGFIDDFMCKLHYAELTEEDIIFSRGDTAQRLIGSAMKADTWQGDISRIVDTYWLHIQMSVKYFLRKDFFKLNGVLRILMDAHTSLLLTKYDKITWGGTANKLHFIPAEKQTHLMRYGCISDFEAMKENLLWSLEQFEKDVEEIAGNDHYKKLGKLIKEYWINNLYQY